jgi:PadR family transcriptional regulator, regulatory protein PadR
MPTNSPETNPPEAFENLRLELRRGCLILAVLAQLREEHYGYTLRKRLAEQGIEMEESTLYPLLRRLESQGLLVSEWREEDKRNKRFYRLSSLGANTLTQLLAEWESMYRAISQIAGAPRAAAGRLDGAAGPVFDPYRDSQGRDPHATQEA